MVSSPVRMEYEVGNLGEGLTPLLVPDLLNRVVPCITCIINDDVNFATAKLNRLLDQVTDGFIVRNISRNSNRSAPI